MKHSVLASEDYLEEKANALRRNTALLGEVGLVLGLRMPPPGATVGVHKDLILDLIQQPLQEEVFTSSASSNSATKSSSKAKGKKAATNNNIQNFDAVNVKMDTTWTVEHGMQVDAMLPGGVEVLGLYLYCSEKTFKAAKTNMQVTTCLRNLARSLKTTKVAQGTDLIVLHIDATSRKMTTKALSDDTLKTLELKYTKVENNLVRVQSVFAMSEMPQVILGGGASGSGTKSGLTKEFNRWKEREASRLERMTLKLTSASSSEGMHDVFVDSSSSAPVIDLVKGAGSGYQQSKIGVKNLSFDIFCPFVKAASSTMKHVHGRMQSQGSIKCVGYVYSRDGLSSVLDALRMDVTRSIKSRIDVYVDEALESEQQIDEDDEDAALHPLIEAQKDGFQGLKTPIFVSLPSRKLFVKDPEGSSLDFELVYSHYSLPIPDQEEEEAIAESKAHLEDLLACKGFVPFDADRKEKDNEEDEDEVGFWNPLAGKAGKVSEASEEPEKDTGSNEGKTAPKPSGGQLDIAQIGGALLFLILAILVFMKLS